MKRIASGLTIVLLAALAMTASAQSWPAKPVRIIVPFSAGGNTDTISRISADWLAKALGQPFVVENRVGAFGTIAAEHVARSPADGYTLFMTTHAQSVTVPIMLAAKRTYDPEKDFATISLVGTNGFVLGIHASIPAANLRDFIEYAKARPGEINFGSAGPGSMGHLTSALLAHRAGIELQHIPFKGGAPAVQSLLAGQVQMYFGNYSDLLPHLASGRVKLLGVSDTRRASQMPNVPTIAEAAFPGYRAVTWNGLIAPAGTPPEIIDRLAQEVQKMVKEPGPAKRLTDMGVDPWGSTPQEFAETIRSELALWADIIKAANVKLE